MSFTCENCANHSNSFASQLNAFKNQTRDLQDELLIKNQNIITLKHIHSEAKSCLEILSNIMDLGRIEIKRKEDGQLMNERVAQLGQHLEAFREWEEQLMMISLMNMPKIELNRCASDAGDNKTLCSSRIRLGEMENIKSMSQTLQTQSESKNSMMTNINPYICSPSKVNDKLSSTKNSCSCQVNVRQQAMITNKSKAKLSCNRINCNFTTSRGIVYLKKHMATHLETKFYVCRLCRERFTTFESLNKHKKFCIKVAPLVTSAATVTQPPSTSSSNNLYFFKCIKCNFETFTIIEFREHVRTHVALNDADNHDEKKTQAQTTINCKKDATPSINNTNDTTLPSTSSSMTNTSQKSSTNRVIDGLDSIKDGNSNGKELSYLFTCMTCRFETASVDKFRSHVLSSHSTTQMDHDLNIKTETPLAEPANKKAKMISSIQTKNSIVNEEQGSSSHIETNAKTIKVENIEVEAKKQEIENGNDLGSVSQPSPLDTAISNENESSKEPSPENAISFVLMHCPHFGCEFIGTSGKLSEHIADKHSVKKLKCPFRYCQKAYKQEKTLNAHIRLKHVSHSINAAPTANNNNINYLQRRKNGPIPLLTSTVTSATCIPPPRIFTQSEQSIQLSNQTGSNSLIMNKHAPFICTEDNCRHIFGTKEQLVVHQQVSHNLYWSKYKCPTCEHLCDTKALLSVHQSTCFGMQKNKPNPSIKASFDAKTQSCHMCNRIFSNSQQLNQHIITMHINTINSSLILTCPTAITPTPQTHKSVFECNQINCGRKFISEHFLKLHLKQEHAFNLLSETSINQLNNNNQDVFMGNQ